MVIPANALQDMVGYISSFYRVGVGHGIPPRNVLGLKAKVLTKSSFKSSANCGHGARKYDRVTGLSALVF